MLRFKKTWSAAKLRSSGRSNSVIMAIIINIVARCFMQSIIHEISKKNTHRVWNSKNIPTKDAETDAIATIKAYFTLKLKEL